MEVSLAESRIYSLMVETHNKVQDLNTSVDRPKKIIQS